MLDRQKTESPEKTLERGLANLYKELQDIRKVKKQGHLDPAEQKNLKEVFNQIVKRKQFAVDRKKYTGEEIAAKYDVEFSAQEKRLHKLNPVDVSIVEREIAEKLKRFGLDASELDVNMGYTKSKLENELMQIGSRNDGMLYDLMEENKSFLSRDKKDPQKAEQE